MNNRLKLIPHPIVKDISQLPVLDQIESLVENNHPLFEVGIKRFNVSGLSLFSREPENSSRSIRLFGKAGLTLMEVDLSDVRIYTVTQ